MSICDPLLILRRWQSGTAFHLAIQNASSRRPRCEFHRPATPSSNCPCPVTGNRATLRALTKNNACDRSLLDAQVPDARPRGFARTDARRMPTGRAVEVVAARTGGQSRDANDSEPVG